ncbi:hypothetical protein [Salinispora arenicola]|uniref:hypothetical protein n=1 Tax=Salinispora arenicola TaxID=168697 RepID=UPI00036908DB|nr:hypothetical protein [Salinispora arenicola]
MSREQDPTNRGEDSSHPLGGHRTGQRRVHHAQAGRAADRYRPTGGVPERVHGRVQAGDRNLQTQCRVAGAEGVAPPPPGCNRTHRGAVEQCGHPVGPLHDVGRPALEYDTKGARLGRAGRGVRRRR